MYCKLTTPTLHYQYRQHITMHSHTLLLLHLQSASVT